MQYPVDIKFRHAKFCKIKSCYDKMSKILREGHALSTDPTLPRAYEASIFEPLNYKFLATPLVPVIMTHRVLLNIMFFALICHTFIH